MLLTVNGITKYFGAELILRDISFVLNPNEHIGLVGANGIGKSTLLKIIVGELQPDHGSVTFAPGIDVGYLPQAITGYADRTIDSLLLEMQGQVAQLAERMRELEAHMTTATGDDLTALLTQYGEASERFEQLGGYGMDHRIDEVLAGLGIAHLPRERVIGTLSGGEKERVGLAALLLRGPDLLLLDEPTNHLDFKTLDWLEGYLRQHKGALLAVSHDRQFLNNTVSAILEIDEYTRTLKTFTGNYDSYLIARAGERAQWIADYEAQQEEIKTLRKQSRASEHYHDFWRGGGKAAGDKFAKGFFKGNTEVATSRRVRNAQERLERIEENTIPKPPDEIRISPEFNPATLAGKLPLRVNDLCKRFGEREVLGGVSLELRLGDRVVLSGPNGSGKSTLLRVIAGELAADSGEVIVQPAVRLGYLDQEQTSMDLAQPAYEWWREGLTGDPDILRADFFRFFLLTYDDAVKPIGALSIGQRRKLQLLKLIATRANLLLLDEPTNHISFDVMEKFEQALAEFPGPVLAVSHDRWFIQRFATQVWDIEALRE